MYFNFEILRLSKPYPFVKVVRHKWCLIFSVMCLYVRIKRVV